MRWARALWRDRTARWLLSVAGLALVLTLVAVSLAHLPFFLVAHGHANITRRILGDFYSQVDIQTATLLWYASMLLLLMLGWGLTRRVEVEWRRLVCRTGLVTVLMSPGILVTSDVTLQVSELLMLPAVVCIVRQSLSSSSSAFFPPSWGSTPFRIYPFWLTFWPVPTLWLATLLVALVHRMQVEK